MSFELVNQLQCIVSKLKYYKVRYGSGNKVLSQIRISKVHGKSEIDEMLLLGIQCSLAKDLNLLVIKGTYLQRALMW